jgi:polyisoprenyl-phosphate glycosyltransferase
MQREDYNLTVIIPFLNEEENLPFLARELDEYFSTRSEIRTEVIFVDDGSTDQSIYCLKKQQYAHFSASVIKLSRNFGSHAALRAGILHARGKFITFLPADLQDPITLIEIMYGKCCAGDEIVFACRKNKQGGFFDKIFTAMYASLMRNFVSKDFPSHGFDVIMFGQKVRKQLINNVEANSSLFLQALLMGFRKSFISYEKNARKAGKSKWTFGKKSKLLIDSFVAFSYAPVRFVSVMGLILAFIGFIWLLYIVIRTLIWHDLTQGWPALVGILMLGFGITNISLGVIAEYLWRTLDASRKRQVFIIDEIIDIHEQE